MKKLTRDDLYSLEKYAEVRSQYRAEVMAHKKNRKVHVGPHATLYFEDRLTMQYQIQEMLRAERIFEPRDSEAELDTYNPLIPDGTNLKATFMLEYDDAGERRAALARLIGIEDKVWIKVGDHDRVWSIADEDMERDTAEKTSSVHFLRFELTPEMMGSAKQGAAIAAGIAHELYTYENDPLPQAVRDSLVNDLD